MSNEQNWKALYEPIYNSSNMPSFLINPVPITKVEISISARNLINLDTFTKSDPQCIVYIKNSVSQNYCEIGKTEIISDNLNPDFIEKILIDYNFEIVQYLKFELWDIDLTNNDFLGKVETTMPEIIANKNRQFVKPLKGLNPKKNYGNLILVVEELSACKQIVNLKFNAKNLKLKGCFNFLIKPSSFLQFWRSNEDGSYSLVHKTRVVWSNRNPSYNLITIKVRELCNADFDRNIKIEVLNYSSIGNHKVLMTVFTTFNQLLKNEAIFKESEDRTEELKLESILLKDSYSFFDYLKGGMEMHFAVAIDFTSSNGPVNLPSSLHYIDPINLKPNSYELALKSIGGIIQYYNSSKMFPGFGFGAKIPPDHNVNHKFPLNENINQPYCEGIENLIFYYKKTLEKVILYGPTNFSPIIEYTAQIASKSTNSKNYFVLLIITDGIICDMPQTKRSIVRSSSLPISIIIVGVGNADFSAMDELDSDDKLLEIDGKKCVRDIVQFVSLNKYIKQNGSYLQSEGDLAREVLYEIPHQVESYMKLRNFKPGT